MRTLFYVPIIHTSSDLGSLAKDVAKRGIVELGQEVWNEHLKTVEGFWNAILLYFMYIDALGLKIYQDGMVAEGEIGQKIVEEGARLGSKNYELVARLLKQGAILMKTEDFNLVKEERDRLLTLIQPSLSLWRSRPKAKSVTQKLIAFIKYKLVKNRLLNKRDRFIAQRINETLNDGERGVLFIGAFHNVKKFLPGPAVANALAESADIQIKEIKDVQRVREYYRLLPFYHKHKEQSQELSRYLISKVEAQI
jgi:hypothetical protein